MRKLLASVALAAALVVPQIGRAADAEPAPNTGALSLSAGTDFVTSYVFRGYIISDTGFIAQPWGQVNAAAYKSDSLTITPYVGVWNDFQGTIPAGTSSWVESDLYGGVDFGVGDFTLGAIYTFYTYPGNGFSEVQELGFKATYNDAKLTEQASIPFAFKPYAAWYFETADPAGKHQYAEIGMNPSYTFKDTPVTITVPVAFGFSPSGYYTKSDGSNAPFGYVSIGGFVSYALPLPAKWGAWSVYGGATYYNLAAYSEQTSDGHNATSWVAGKAGLVLAY